MLRAPACALLVLSISPAAWADQPRRLTEAELIREYQRVEPRLAVAEANVTAMKATVTEARMLVNPQLAFNRESTGGVAETFAGAGLTFDLGGRGARIDSARARVRAARQALTHRRRQLTVDALARFYTALYAHQRVGILERARAPLSVLVARLRSQASAGESAGYDRDRLELELVRFEAALTAAKNRRQVARVELARLLGKAGASIIPSGSLTVKAPPPLQQLLAGAVEGRADYRAARARLSAARASARSASRWWIPAVNLQAGVRTVAQPGQTDTGYAVGLSIELPLFNRRQAARRRAAASGARARATMSWVALRTRGQLRAAHATLRARLGMLRKLEREQLRRATRLVKRAALLYHAGERNVVDLVDAYRTALDIRLRRLELQYRAKLAELDLLRALGGSR
jgi:cobalt-zinc-cadmium efflux system outer membrane protein